MTADTEQTISEFADAAGAVADALDALTSTPNPDPGEFDAMLEGLAKLSARTLRLYRVLEAESLRVIASRN